MANKFCIWRVHTRFRADNPPRPVSSFWPSKSAAQRRATLHRQSDRKEVGRYISPRDYHTALLLDRTYQVRQCQSEGRCACRRYAAQYWRGQTLSLDTPAQPFFEVEGQGRGKVKTKSKSKSKRSSGNGLIRLLNLWFGGKPSRSAHTEQKPKPRRNLTR